jgi:hypothetical protein
MPALKRIIGRPRVATTAFYICCIGFAVANWKLANQIDSSPFVLVPGPDPLGALSKSLDAYTAMNSLLTTLSTGLLAGLGLFLTGSPKKRYPMRDFWPAALSAVCVCDSLYWGYISSQNVEWAIENVNENLNLGLDLIQRPRELQCLMMLLGVVFFADFVRRDSIKVD